MKAKEITFTRAAVRQLAGLAPAERVRLRESLSHYAADPRAVSVRIEASRAAPIARLGVGEATVALVEGDERIVVLRLGANAEAAVSALRDLATGREERVAERALDRLLAGENPVKAWREHRRATQAALARKAGINANYLSQIETGRRHPSDAVKSALLRALAIDALDFGLLVDLPGRAKAKRHR
jgi:DNA-binding XRE family transcriptional regulator